MIIEKSGYVLYLIIISIFFSYYIFKKENHFFKTLRKYWFVRESVFSKFRKAFFILGFVLLILSLIDLRGPEEKVDTSIPDQKTIVLIDSSMSMLAEDVRPSRYVKAIMVARHFVKNSAGHQISIVLFSDTQKKLIPFTDDLDLIDSRLSSLESNNLNNGGSNIRQALAESIQYFKTSKNTGNEKGNILLITDTEEGKENFKLKLPDEINLAVVGIGTLKGGLIPIRDKSGVFRGYKRNGKENVVTRLNEDFLKKMAQYSNNYMYKIVTSYNLPTNEILEFFNKKFLKANSSGQVSQRPVWSHYVAMLGVIVIAISIMFKRLNQIILMLVVFTSFQPKAHGQDDQELRSKLKKGIASSDEKLELVDLLMKNKEYSQASDLLDEVNTKKNITRVKTNQAVAIALDSENKDPERFQKAIALTASAIREETDNKLLKVMRENLKYLLKSEQQNKEQDKKEENKDKEKENNSDSKENKSENSDKGQEKKDNKSDKDNSNEPSEEKEKKDKGKNSQSENNEEDEKKSLQDKLKQKQQEIKNKRKMIKTPAIVKQLMSEDRKLQEKYIDTSTRENNYDKMDW